LNLKTLFGLPQTDLPEGMTESCFVNFFRPFYDFPSLPTLDCSVTQGRDSVGYLNTIVNGTVIEDTVSTVVQNSIVFDMTLISSALIMLIAVGIFGMTLCELMFNKFDYLLSPITILVKRRYDFVIERNRLESMKGHP